MKKIVRLTESDLARIVKLVIKEDEGKTKDEHCLGCQSLHGRGCL